MGCYHRHHYFQHLCTHTREKPYVCGEPGCDATFGNGGTVSQHRKAHRIKEACAQAQLAGALGGGRGNLGDGDGDLGTDGDDEEEEEEDEEGCLVIDERPEAERQALKDEKDLSPADKMDKSTAGPSSGTHVHVGQ